MSVTEAAEDAAEVAAAAAASATSRRPRFFMSTIPPRPAHPTVAAMTTRAKVEGAVPAAATAGAAAPCAPFGAFSASHAGAAPQMPLFSKATTPAQPTNPSFAALPTRAVAAGEVAAAAAVAAGAAAGAAAGTAAPRAPFGAFNASHAGAASQMPGISMSTTWVQPANPSSVALPTGAGATGAAAAAGAGGVMHRAPLGTPNISHAPTASPMPRFSKAVTPAHPTNPPVAALPTRAGAEGAAASAEATAAATAATAAAEAATAGAVASRAPFGTWSTSHASSAPLSAEFPKVVLPMNPSVAAVPTRAATAVGETLHCPSTPAHLQLAPAFPTSATRRECLEWTRNAAPASSAVLSASHDKMSMDEASSDDDGKTSVGGGKAHEGEKVASFGGLKSVIRVVAARPAVEASVARTPSEVAPIVVRATAPSDSGQTGSFLNRASQGGAEGTDCSKVGPTMPADVPRTSAVSATPALTAEPAAEVKSGSAPSQSATPPFFKNTTTPSPHENKSTDGRDGEPRHARKPSTPRSGRKRADSGGGKATKSRSGPGKSDTQKETPVAQETVAVPPEPIAVTVPKEIVLTAPVVGITEADSAWAVTTDFGDTPRYQLGAAGVRDIVTIAKEWKDGDLAGLSAQEDSPAYGSAMSASPTTHAEASSGTRRAMRQRAILREVRKASLVGADKRGDSRTTRARCKASLLWAAKASRQQVWRQGLLRVAEPSRPDQQERCTLEVLAPPAVVTQTIARIHAIVLPAMRSTAARLRVARKALRQDAFRWGKCLREIKHKQVSHGNRWGRDLVKKMDFRCIPGRLFHHKLSSGHIDTPPLTRNTQVQSAPYISMDHVANALGPHPRLCPIQEIAYQNHERAKAESAAISANKLNGRSVTATLTWEQVEDLRTALQQEVRWE